VSKSPTRQPRILAAYERYLVDQDSAAYVTSVCQHYAVATLQRLAAWGNRMSRRAAVLALGYVADYSANATMGRALVDSDRGVRILAERGIRNLWIRVGKRENRERLAELIRLNTAKQFPQAVEAATELVHDSPWLAEVWNQRAVALFELGQYEESIRDCHQTLEINPYHFAAATGMGKCYLQLDNRVAALEAFRRALRLNPQLEDVRAHVVYLQRALQDE